MDTPYTSFFTTAYSLVEFDGPTAAVDDEDILDNLYIPGPLATQRLVPQSVVRPIIY